MTRTQLILSAAAVLAVLGGCGAQRVAPGLGPAPEPQGHFEVVGRGPVAHTHTTDLYVFRGANGRDYAYTGTSGTCQGCPGGRMYVWDVTEPERPVLTDSVVVDARVVNDVTVNAERTLAVITREGAPTRRNGVTILDLSDPAHPTVAADFWETLTGGVHNAVIDGNLVYAVHNGTADLHIIDISDLSDPRQVGRWGVPAHPGKSLHDVWVENGLAYLSYWDDGLVILDVGNGIREGTPEQPVFVSQYRYRTEVEGREYGNTHTAVPYTNRAGRSFVFVGDEILPPNFDVRDPAHRAAGYVHVVDVSNIEMPAAVARYEVPRAGAHNLWVEDDVLYVAYFNGGLRAVDVSGELRGELRTQGRELAVLPTTDERALVADRPLTWAPQVHRGRVFATDFNSGLWIARLVRPQ